MTEKTLQVSDGLIVCLDYMLRLENVEVVDSSEEREPIEFMQGQRQIVPGLEDAIYGMAVGEEKSVVVETCSGIRRTEP